MIDIDHLQGWIGRQETRHDSATLVPLQALSATLDRDESWSPGDEVPPLWHWLYFLPLHRQSEIGPDGHARRGGFLPPVPLPRRMWAGSQLRFMAPLRAGQALTRTSTIDDVRLKDGRSGPLVFVKVRHDIVADGQPVIEEFHDIVYRPEPTKGAPVASNPSSLGSAASPSSSASSASSASTSAPSGAPALIDRPWSRTITPDDVLLFRYSALTFNGHRIHYDRRYVTQVEGYPGLIVHGPLIATLLLDLLRRQLPSAAVKTFEFRALQPVFDVAPFSVHGGLAEPGRAQLWALTPQGEMAMQASATFD